jgi:glycosyltransferase involved in cell wall biosynthesis
MVKLRPAEEVLLVAHASRLQTAAHLQPRPAVRKVLWENAIHHNPRYDPRKVGMPRERYQELEGTITELLRERGAELLFIDAWRETQTYAEWERTVLDADIAIECKALGGQYIDYQSQKPAVKVLNYMSLGLPVVCDSLPAYRDLGQEGKELLFADTLEQWRTQLARLLDDFDLRVRLGEGARKVAEPYSIDNVCARYIGFFERIVAAPTVGTKVASVKA